MDGTTTESNAGRRASVPAPGHHATEGLAMIASDSPTRRRCPACRIRRPAGEFIAITTQRPYDGRGIAWRICPACGHHGPLRSFVRVDAAGREVRR
jgi:hypothetical protein